MSAQTPRATAEHALLNRLDAAHRVLRSPTATPEERAAAERERVACEDGIEAMPDTRATIV